MVLPNSLLRWSLIEEGVLGSKHFRVFLASNCGRRVSPWHDIPLYRNTGKDLIVNFINEIPKGTRHKMEICKHEHMNPIKQDTKNSELRYFKTGDIPFNYGALPQTWEDPDWVHPDTECGGDGDPLDAVEVSNLPLNIGEVVPVRIIGVLGLIDQNETDWKVIVKRTDHEGLEPIEFAVDDLETIRHWFRTYKVAEGCAENQFVFDGVMKDASYAHHVIEEAHSRWKTLNSR